MFTTSTYNQPGSKQPYFVLSASDGVCVSSIPADASNVVSKSITGRYAVRSVRRMREMRETVSDAYITFTILLKLFQARLTQEAKDAKEKLESLDSDLDKALELAQSGDNELGPRARFDQRGDFLITYLKRISEDCDQNPINASDETWAKGSLADRVHLISEDRISKEKELTTLKAAYETIVSDLSEQIRCMDEGERKRRLEAILKGKSP
jgi:soluble cytochrome b562